MKRIQILKLESGKEPFSEWLDALPLKAQARVHSMIDRVSAGGSKKNVRSLGEGLFEMKIDYGPGFRTYFCELKNTIILLLLGGNKSSQKKDIEKARLYRRQYVSK